MQAPEEAVGAFVTSGDHAGLAQYCENFELDLRHSDVELITSRGIYKVHLLSYLLQGQLDRARFLWKRVPEEIKSADAELQAVWAVGKAMWQTDHRLAVQQSAASAFAWSGPLVATLINTLHEQYLKHSFTQIGAAYATVSAESLAEKLGVPVAKVHEFASAAGWTADAVSGFYKPLQPESDKQQSVKLEQLQKLTNYVAHLEQEVR